MQQKIKTLNPDLVTEALTQILPKDKNLFMEKYAKIIKAGWPQVQAIRLAKKRIHQIRHPKAHFRYPD